MQKQNYAIGSSWTSTPADVKGANLLVETNGRVKLADFGMAKQMVEAASFTKSFKGSAFWMVSATLLL